MRCDDPESSARTIRQIFDGERRDTARDLVVINAAAGLFIGGAAADLNEARLLAEKSIDCGAASAKLNELVKATGRMNENFLTTIIERKRIRLEQVRAERPIELVRAQAMEIRSRSQPHLFRSALQSDGKFKVIAEIKRASPSKGVIKEVFEPTEIARAYERGGAAALSVLTEEDYFLGSLDDLRSVRAASSLPILRKDFMIDEYQIFETAAAGADALLLIVAALDDSELSRFREIAEAELGLDALVEVHTAEEMRRAKCAGATLIGVNNRNLSSLEVSLNTSIELAPKAPANAILVSESGLRSIDDLKRLQQVGYQGFLIGEALMRAEDPAAALEQLTRPADGDDKVRIKVCGITNLNDARMCVEAGVDLLGFNFYPRSLRYIEPPEARRIIEQLPPGVISVGIFVNEKSPERVERIADEAGVGAVQLHGEETSSYCRALKDRFVIKALRVRDDFVPEQTSEYKTEAVLLDSFNAKARGGTGESFDWSVAKRTRPFVSKLFLAGGLTPENVTKAIEIVRPYAVDACSSLEREPGTKDEGRVRAFIAAVRRASLPRLRNIRMESTQPDNGGHWGPYGGRYVPETLMAALEELTEAYEQANADQMFSSELEALLRNYSGRPTPLFPCCSS